MPSIGAAPLAGVVELLVSLVGAAPWPLVLSLVGMERVDIVNAVVGSV